MKEKFNKRKVTVDPFVQSLLPEDDDTLKKQVGVGSVMALGAALWASTVTFQVIHQQLRGDKDAKVTMEIDYEQKQPEPEKKKPKKVSEGEAGKSGKMGSPDEPKNIKPTLNNNVTQSVLVLLESHRADAMSASTIFKQNFSKDLQKDLQRVSQLTKNGKNSIGAGNRRDGASVGFNPDGTFGNGPSGDGLGASLSKIIGGMGTKIGGNAMHSISAPKASTIEMGSGGGTRSKSSIMRVVRSRMPGLRHVFNKHLKEKPGFSGKVTLRMTISPSGKIIKIAKVSSSTKFSKFDSSVLNKVKTWKFEKIKSGNTTVTIPFTFSE